MTETLINGRWTLELPEHRSARPEWPWWEAARLAAMSTVIGPGSVVYDVGGEEGDFPALWASWGAEVVIAEPNPRVWPNIRWIFDANDLPAPLACWPGFLGDEGNAPNPLPGWPECAFGDVIGDHGFCQLGERPDLPMTTIDHLVATAKAPTCITIDVEGSELHVLRGATSTLTAFRPDVFVSIHPEFMEHHYGIFEGVEVVRAFMRSLGYREQFLAIDHEHHWWFRP